MSLLPGKKNIGHNISEMEEHGHPKNVAIAASLNVARKSGVKIKSPSKNHDRKKDRGESGRG
jgi:hypothetical protein